MDVAVSSQSNEGIESIESAILENSMSFVFPNPPSIFILISFLPISILKNKSSARSTFMPWSSKSFTANKQILYRNVIFDHFPLLS